MTTATHPPFCATKLPWQEHPFRLISWWDMLKFSAHSFVEIASFLSANFGQRGNSGVFTGSSAYLGRLMQTVGDECHAIGLHQSSRMAFSLLMEVEPVFSSGNADPVKIETRLEELLETIKSELSLQSFFSMPLNRIEWYSKTALQILGDTSCKRFPSAAREVEEGSKCFAFGRYTACAFHFARATEAGMQGLSRAIDYVPKNGNWNKVWQVMGNQIHDSNGKRIKDKKQLPSHWQSHASFLERVKDLLQAVAQVWRNNIAHLVDTYNEPQAREIMTVIPIFLKSISAQMDEAGTLY